MEPDVGAGEFKERYPRGRKLHLPVNHDMISHMPFQFRNHIISYLLVGLVVLFACHDLSAQNSIPFVDSSNSAGLTLSHWDGLTKEPYLPHLMVAGVALFDFDGDGSLDVYLLGGKELFPKAEKQPSARAIQGNTLYRNRGDGTFVDVTDRAGVRSGAFALGVVAADLDNDGDQDLVTSNFGPAEMYVNNGDGTFTPKLDFVNNNSGSTPFGAGIACLDIDNDGCLDLFASNYVDFTIERYNAIASKSFPYPPGPKDFPVSSDCLFHNEGDGTYRDVSRESGIARVPGPSMGVICGDFDGDNDMDIFVCSDASANQYFVNNGKGIFEDQALLSGLAFDLTGNANGSMGVDAGDYDNDGMIDLLITNYTGQTPVLYHNLGRGLFEDASRQSRVGRTVLAHTNWGVGLVDFDNDGDLDVFFANGHFLKNIDSIDDRTTYLVANTLMQNDGTGRFSDVSKSSGSGLSVIQSSRGAAFGDMDRDGDVDAIVLNANAPPTYLENQSKQAGNWVDIQLIGTQANRDGVGASVRVRSSAGEQVKLVHAGRGYQSHYGTLLHFGLGKATSLDSVEVTWPDGKQEAYRPDSICSKLFLAQGTGRSKK